MSNSAGEEPKRPAGAPTSPISSSDILIGFGAAVVAGLVIAVLALAQAPRAATKPKWTAESAADVAAKAKSDAEKKAIRVKTAQANADKIQAVWNRFDALPTKGKTPEALAKTVTEVIAMESVFVEPDLSHMRKSRLFSIAKREEAIEVAKPMTVRVTEALSSGDGAGICRAKAIVGAVFLEEDLRAPETVKAKALVRSKETAILRKEWADGASDRAASRGLVCRDGSDSPSCRCSGPRRGCCSHHGGVAGCEPLPAMPTEIECR